MKEITPEIIKASDVLDSIRKYGKLTEKQFAKFSRLPYLLTENTLMPKQEVKQLYELIAKSKKHVDILISVGIGGSYLGNKVLFDLFCGPYWNLDKDLRHGYPQVFFSGNNLDPDALAELISYIKKSASKTVDRYHVMILAISKSGMTIEPATAIDVFLRELKNFCEIEVVTITDPKGGKLLELSRRNEWTHFSVPEGIGGRFSVLSQVGIVFGALCGIDVKGLLKGAADVEAYCQSGDIDTNPALALAAMKYLATTQHGIVNEVIMPYGESLRSLGWWYAQLMAESLGKKYDLSGNVIRYGRTLASCLGTTDMHSMTQEHQEGKNNKLIQFISVKKRKHEITANCEEQGRKGQVALGRILNAALNSNARALASENRMSCEISIPEITPYYIGGLLYFFMLAAVYEGAMAGINPFDQPGVEAYKKILHESVAEFIAEDNMEG